MQEGESEGKAYLRTSTRAALCRVGYAPCVKEAQIAFNKWMESKTPDDEEP